MQTMRLDKYENKEARPLNELRYIFSWMLIVVGFGIGWYMSFPRRTDLEKQRLKREAKWAKIIGYSYMIASIVAIIAYRV